MRFFNFMENLAVEAESTTAASIGHQLTKMSYNWFFERFTRLLNIHN